MTKIAACRLLLFCTLLMAYCPSVKAQQHPVSLNPLMTAISSGDVTLVGQLIEDGADVNAPFLYFEESPLSWAVAASANPEPALDIIQLLIDKGADVNGKNKRGMTPLMWAARRSSDPKTTLKILQLLIAQGADVEGHVPLRISKYGGWTSLAFAVANSPSAEIVHFLVDKGANPNWENEHAGNLLILAAKRPADTEVTYKIIEHLLEKGAEIEAKDGGGQSPLIGAIKSTGRTNASPKIVQLLLERGANIEATVFHPTRRNRLQDGLTPLLYAAKYTQIPQLVQLLLDDGANIHAKDKEGRTILMVASGNRSRNRSHPGTTKQILQLLVDNGANIASQAGNGWTPLISAVRNYANPELIQWFLDNAASVKTRTVDQQTALIVAARYTEFPEVIEILLAAGADIDAYDDKKMNALMHSNKRPGRSKENNQITLMLLENGANALAVNNKGISTLMLAAEQSISPEILQLLIEKGADIHGKSESGLTPLMLALKSSSSIEVVQFLLGHGARIDDKDNAGNTPLLHAVGKSSPEVVEKLLALGSDIETRNNKHETPLLIASSSVNQQLQRLIKSEDDGSVSVLLISPTDRIIDLLVKNGANVNAADKSGSTALKRLSSRSHTASAQLLIDNGADVNARDALGFTPLITAIFNKRVEMISFLIDKGADVNQSTGLGLTPLMWAARVCGPHVVDLLLKAGANPIAVDKTGKNVIEYAVKNRDLRNTDVMGEIENHISAQTYSTAIQWAVLISLVALLMVGVKRARTHNRNPTVL